MTRHASIRALEETASVSRRAGHVDIGSDAPLDAGGGAADLDRRDVSLRWLAASALTGLTGAALIGAAAYGALQGESTFAELPEKAVATGRPVPGDERASNVARKGDKLVRASIVASAKHSFRAPVTLKAGEREVIKVRPFIRIATGLATATGVYATDIPPFNPMRLFAEGGGTGSDRAPVPEASPETSDAEVSVMKTNLSTVAVPEGGPALSDDDAAAQVEEERRALAESGRRTAVQIPPQLMLSRTLRQPDALGEALGYAPSAIDAPFSSIEVRVVPENVTTLGKLDPRAVEALTEERDLALRRGETIEGILRVAGATAEQLRSIMAALGQRVRPGALPDSAQLRVLVAPGPRPGDPRQIVRVILFGERGIEAIAAVNDRGAFVSVNPPPSEEAAKARKAPQPSEEEEEEESEAGGVRLYESLYETCLKHDLPRQTVEDLVRIFGYDVDFQRRVAPGDSIELFYSVDEDTGGDRPEILYAALSVAGEQRRVYRFQSPEDQSIDFFDDQGRSLKKFLIRKPVAEGRLTSGFGYRRHPIMGYSKMHTGVDWANPIGTPILAAGSGTVIKAEWDSGYGRRTEVQHANGYVTAYNHQSRFASGIRPGARVRQGQVIGYVGNTGLSTGPHLHYEIIVNGRFVDPMKIRVPRGRELDGRALAEFKRQREQVDALLQKAGSSTRLAQGETR